MILSFFDKTFSDDWVTTRYLQLASGLWTILSGPWSGLQVPSKIFCLFSNHLGFFCISNEQVAAASEEGHLLVGTLSFSLSLQI